MRTIVKMCNRCLGTGIVARHYKKICYNPCPRCAGSGGSTEWRTTKPWEVTPMEMAELRKRKDQAINHSMRLWEETKLALERL